MVLISMVPGRNGLVHVYTGNGKGKTTAALGLALRACGHDLKIHIIQFMKGNIDYGELKSIAKIDGITLVQGGREDFVNPDDPDPIDLKLARDAFELAKKIVNGGEYDMVILDELNITTAWKLIPLPEVIELIRCKPDDVELVLTGRYAPDELLALADYVTEMREVKHPYEKGIDACDGIEH
jgi:cob(I)alamin adenosyltransferase